MPKLLLVCRDLKLRKKILNILSGQNVLFQKIIHRLEVETCSSLKEVEERLANQWFDSVILFENDAAGLTETTGSQILSHLRSAGKETPVILVMDSLETGVVENNLANLLRLGVYDIFSTPLDLERLCDTAYRAVQMGMKAYETEKKILYELAKLGPLSLGRLNQMRLVLRALIVQRERQQKERQVIKASSTKRSKSEAA